MCTCYLRPVAVARSSSDDSAMLCTFGFVDAIIMFSHNGKNADQCIYTWSLRRSELFVVTRQVATLNCICVMSTILLHTVWPLCEFRMQV